MRISPKKDLLHAGLTESILGAFYHVYNRLDYGFLEAVYAEALARTLAKRGHHVEREVSIVIYFEGEAVALQRVDMIVDGVVVVEIKSTHDIARSSHRQLQSYLRGSELQVGLLLHFGPQPRFYRVVDTRSPRRAKTDPR
jgi:GxxExxY protein